MKDQEIIQKAQKALKELGFGTKGQYKPKVIRVTDPILLKYDEDAKRTYTVSFDYDLPDGRLSSTFVEVDIKTNQLLRIIGRHGSVEIPDALR